MSYSYIILDLRYIEHESKSYFLQKGIIAFNILETQYNDQYGERWGVKERRDKSIPHFIIQALSLCIEYQQLIPL